MRCKILFGYLFACAYVCKRVRKPNKTKLISEPFVIQCNGDLWIVSASATSMCIFWYWFSALKQSNETILTKCIQCNKRSWFRSIVRMSRSRILSFYHLLKRRAKKNQSYHFNFNTVFICCWFSHSFRNSNENGNGRMAAVKRIEFVQKKYCFN